MQYCDVIVDLSQEAVDRLFTYAVPEKMTVGVGWQVEVPFGSRTLEGFVIALKDDCPLEAKRIKSVRRAVRDYPVILPELIELAKWMHGRYLCNLVDALRLMVPAQMRGDRVREKTRRMAHLNWSETQVNVFRNANPRATAQIQLLEKLLEGDCPAAALSASALKSLLGKGAVCVDSEEVRRKPSLLADESRARDPVLMPSQQRAVDEIVSALDACGGRFLLNGVTGSGKTEVYIHVIRRALETDKGAIVLVPEIALTPQMVSWLHARFGGDAAVLHSRLSAGERYDEWKRIRMGVARVVIGARSAVFAPVKNLGAIIIDEEHEHTYQSDKRPRYDAREIAWKRMNDARGVLILGSATPSISSYMRAMPSVKSENRLTLIELRERVMGRPMPKVELVDMRSEFEKGNHSVFSAPLAEALRECLEVGKQAVLFINRRGHSSFVSCRACGYVVKCDQCDVSMTYHQSDNLLKCHYCGNMMSPPARCPKCQSKYIKYFGAGTQKIEEEVQRVFPDARTVRVDVDTTREKDAHEKLLNRFSSGAANVMIGTQMIAKGLDFPKVTLVGVVAADMTLNLPDYRSAERTFQLITQVAGRAGRADDPGRVIVQTYDPEHYAIKMAADQDYRAFYMRESLYRRKSLYPPFTVIARIVFSAREESSAQKEAERVEALFNEWLDATGARRDVIQMRALEAPIKRLRGLFRWQVFLKMYFKGDISGATGKMQELADGVENDVRAELEINPANMF